MRFPQRLPHHQRRLRSIAPPLLFASLTLLLGACATGRGAASGGTPTPMATPPTTAVLGGPLTAFRAQFGPPTQDTVFFRSTDAQGHPVSISAPQVVGTDGQSRASWIQLEPDGDAPHWDPNATLAEYQPFLPADATHTQDVPSKHGLHYRYQSARLAAAFPANLFVDGQGQRVPPGTIDVWCPTVTALNGQQRSYQCNLKAGEWPIF